MLIYLQFPFANMTRLLAEPGRQVHSPTWPLPNPGRDFIRCSGQVQRRSTRSQWATPWNDEVFYCNGRNILRLPSIRQALPSDIKLHAWLRRIHDDGAHMIRFQVIVNASPRADDSGISSRAILESFLRQDSVVTQFRAENKTGALARQGRPLAEVLEDSRYRVEDLPRGFNCVRHGNPVILIQHKVGELDVDEYTVETRLPGATARLARRSFVGVPVTAWFVEMPSSQSDRQDERRIRQAILRLSAESEVLGAVLRFTSNSSDFNFDKAAMRRYFKKAIGLFKRQTYYIDGADGISELVVAFAESIGPDYVSLLEEQTANRIRETGRDNARVDGSSHPPRGNRRRLPIDQSNGQEGILKVENYEDNSVTINLGDGAQVVGNVTAARTIADSFNSLESIGDDELKTRAKEFVRLAALMSGYLSDDDQKAVARRLKTFSDEVSAGEPDKSIIASILHTIADKAKQFAEWAQPVAKAVSAVIALLP